MTLSNFVVDFVRMIVWREMDWPRDHGRVRAFCGASTCYSSVDLLCSILGEGLNICAAKDVQCMVNWRRDNRVEYYSDYVELTEECSSADWPIRD